MELEENAAAAAEARDCACAEAPADEIKAVPMDGVAAENNEEAGFDEAGQTAGNAAEQPRKEERSRTE